MLTREHVGMYFIACPTWSGGFVWTEEPHYDYPEVDAGCPCPCTMPNMEVHTYSHSSLPELDHVALRTAISFVPATPKKGQAPGLVLLQRCRTTRPPSQPSMVQPSHVD